MPFLNQKLRIDEVAMKKREKSFQDPMMGADGVGYVLSSLALYSVVLEAAEVSPAERRQSLDPT